MQWESYQNEPLKIVSPFLFTKKFDPNLVEKNPGSDSLVLPPIDCSKVQKDGEIKLKEENSLVALKPIQANEGVQEAPEEVDQAKEAVFSNFFSDSKLNAKQKSKLDIIRRSILRLVRRFYLKLFQRQNCKIVRKRYANWNYSELVAGMRRVIKRYMDVDEPYQLSKFYIKFFNIHSQAGTYELSEQERRGSVVSDACTKFSRIKFRDIMMFKELRDAIIYLYERMDPSNGVVWIDESEKASHKLFTNKSIKVEKELKKIYQCCKALNEAS